MTLSPEQILWYGLYRQERSLETGYPVAPSGFVYMKDIQLLPCSPSKPNGGFLRDGGQ